MTNSLPTFCHIVFVPRSTSRNLVTGLYIKSEKKLYNHKHIYDPSNKQKQKIPIPVSNDIQ